MPTKSKTPDAVTLLLSDARGVYIPRDFVNNFDLAEWQGIKAGDAMICENPEHPFYWDAWDAILSAAHHTDEEGNTYHLYQDGDLWALCYDRMSEEEKRNFGMEE